MNCKRCIHDKDEKFECAKHGKEGCRPDFKTVKMALVGEDGNAFAILGRFKKAARQAGWSQDEISAVVDDATSGDYDHLLATIMEHMEHTEDE